ncbi:ATP-binding protein [Shewanella litorisediminis]|uniref:histidine kinase n=1 Tax=Shewanella litorisediminis TaxID=1173586 RepID=A0ABX7G3X6_9GAMM|nr:ATP-binding protein [Shewanella litorisediminis]MCL2919386.1 ATP-binding protein [Shewanella litorisediminis]QRH01999.1 sensor histidine kinase [Shewanella litorisediminis]
MSKLTHVSLMVTCALLICCPLYLGIKKLQAFCARVSLNGEKNLLVQVEDDGPGFIAADTDSLLAAFHQGELSAHQLYQGVGLGLSTVALLCRHLSAKVTLGRSQTLGGACVTLEFPSAP